MKKIFFILLAILFILVLAGCGETKTVHCDNCKKEVAVDAGSNMEEDWIVFCEECNKELFGDDPILGGN